MAVSDDFLYFVLEQFYLWNGVEARKMFGGAGLYRDELMFGAVFDDVAYLKVDDSTRDKYIQAGAIPFTPFPGKTTIMSFYSIPPDVLENPEELIVWAEKAVVIQKKKK